MDEHNQRRWKGGSLSMSMGGSKSVSVKALGLVRGISDTEATTKRDFRLAEQEALLLMLKQAHDMGANAVVGVRLTTGTYEANGSQWQVSRPVYTGTAVRI